MIAFGPFGELDLGHQLRFEPLDAFHDLCRDCLAAARAGGFGKICERTLRRSQAGELAGYIAAQRRSKSISDFGDEDQVAPFVITDQQILESVTARLITADHKL